MRTPPAAHAPYVPMTGRDLPDEGDVPLRAPTRAALAKNPALTAEVKVFSAELRDMTTDAASARVAHAVAIWRNEL